MGDYLHPPAIVLFDHNLEVVEFGFVPPKVVALIHPAGIGPEEGAVFVHPELENPGLLFVREFGAGTALVVGEVVELVAVAIGRALFGKGQWLSPKQIAKLLGSFMFSDEFADVIVGCG